MRSIIYAPRLRALAQSTTILAITGLMAACSTDASRLDDMLTSSTQLTDNQSSIIRTGPAVAQPYPGDVSNQGIRVGNRLAASDSVVGQPIASPVTRSALPVATRSKPDITVANRSAVPSSSNNGPIILQPRKTDSDPLRLNNTDTMTTGTATAAIPSAPKSAAANPVGWKNTQGTWVTVKSGETLYNMSRRYGVPVMAIMNANKIQDANNVAAGSRVLIPTYNYASTAPVSAPDSDPVTKASRSSRGFQGQARGRVAVPKVRSPQTLAVSKPAEKVTHVSRKSASAQDGRYIVKSGDTLSGIAYRHGVSTAAIRTANGMSNNVVRLGASLVIPSASQKIVAVKTPAVDSTTTGSIPPKDVKSKTVKPTTAASIASRSTEKVSTPKATSSGAFRWPARGRLISKFGDRSRTGSNDGIDISMPEGTPVKASENGTVIYSGSELEDFGKLILVSHADGWVSAYAHASSTLVRRGDKVRRGQVIAKSGRTGNATVPKLHFELRKNSNPVNPLKHLGS